MFPVKDCLLSSYTLGLGGLLFTVLSSFLEIGLYIDVSSIIWSKAGVSVTPFSSLSESIVLELKC